MATEMTAAKLKELEAKARTETDPLKRFGNLQALDAYLASHAQDFIKLMEAAEHMLKMYDAPDSAGSSLNYYASLQELRQALAALNKEQS